MKIDGDLAEIIGIQIGDGCISVTKRYKEFYIGGDLIEEREYHDKWVAPLLERKIMIPLTGKRTNYKEYPCTGVYGFYCFDKRIVEFFNKLGISPGSKINLGIPKQILEDPYLAKRCLRGLFDTDGNIYFDRNRSAKFPTHNRPIIKIGTVSKILSDQIFDLLFELGFHPRKKKPYKGKRDKNTVHTIMLYRIGDVYKFIRNIGFKSSKHYTKWLIFEKFGECPSGTNLSQRKKLLEQESL